MHRIDTPTADVDKHGAGKNGFRASNKSATPAIGATAMDADYFDMLQEEQSAVVEATGATLTKGTNTQLLTAIRAMRRWDANANVSNVSPEVAVGLDYAGGRFLLGAASGVIKVSDFGVVWTAATTSPAQNSVAFDYNSGTSRYVAVGVLGQVATSTDAGDNWATQTSGTSEALTGVAWSGTTWCAVGANGTIITAPLGAASWTTRTPDAAFASNFNDILWDGSQFVIVGDGTIQTSPDGVTWTQRDSGTNYEAIAHGNGRYVVTGGSGDVANSQDAVTWTARSFEGTDAYDQVVFDGHYFVAASRDVECSRLGDSWARIAKNDSGDWTTLAFGAGRYLGPTIGGGGLYGSARSLSIA